jgi:hypothetical protein
MVGTWTLSVEAGAKLPRIFRRLTGLNWWRARQALRWDSPRLKRTATQIEGFLLQSWLAPF